MSTQQQESILVVDDNPTNLKVLFDLLNEAGYKIIIAKGGESALVKAEQCLPDIILLDVKMPGIDGFETCVRLKSKPKTQDIPVIFMTALSDTLNKLQGLQLGAVDYITKPFIQLEEVLARVTLQLDVRQNQRHQLQQAKFETLAQSILGVEQEMKVPLSSLLINLVQMQSQSDAMLHLLHQYQDLVPEAEDLAAFCNLSDLEQQFKANLTSCKTDVNQLAQLISSLQTFTHAETAAHQLVDINAELDNALLLAQAHLLGKWGQNLIQIHKHYDDLPGVKCYPAKLNQVFTALLMQAFDNLEARFGLVDIQDQPDVSPQVWIKTSFLAETNHIQIQIEDNGFKGSKLQKPLMLDAVATPPVQEQMQPLGLMLAHSIVTDQHQGQIQYDSASDKGMVFNISLRTEPQHSN